ncbi:MAG: cell division protein FtsA [Bacilli bacterium]|nr:cell division protein FtsA [Bacilli bacterium]
MSHVYTGIELGTDSVKIVVAEKNQDIFHVLASCSTKSKGIKNGQITDDRACAISIQKTIDRIEKMLGFRVKKVICAVPPTDCKMDIVVGNVDVVNPSEITGLDVSNVLNEAIKGHSSDGFEIITATPISFIVDNNENIRDPKGMSGDTLEAKIVISSIPKGTLYKLLEVINMSGLETIDVAYTSTGDYFASHNERYDNSVGCVINIGESSTNVSIFNKGIQIKNSLLPVGSNNVDKDLSYVFGCTAEDSRYLKENFVLAMKTYADETEKYSVTCSDGTPKDISQVEASEVVEARVREILKLSKNEIKNLTNREIRYIIVTGGLSELQGFHYLVDSEFDGLARVCKISTVGIRHNKYSSAYGVIRYFDDKLSLRGRDYNMISSYDEEILTSTENNLNDDYNIRTIFGHLYD